VLLESENEPSRTTTRASNPSIITKSSTEAELVGATDGANQVIHLRSFLIAQGYEEKPAVLYQDNMSAIALIKKGKSGSMRTRHIDVKYYWLTERCEEGIVVIVYMPTEEMGAANILTKAVLGDSSWWTGKPSPTGQHRSSSRPNINGTGSSCNVTADRCRSREG